MPNELLVKRMAAIQQVLLATHSGSSAMSSASKGSDRERFLQKYLEKVLPPIYRFGSGDATDVDGNRSGQLDIVVELPFSPSIPWTDPDSSRVYLAEGIAAVLEVKSDLSNQWNEFSKTAGKLQPIKREFGATMSMGEVPHNIPIFGVGYTGWKKIETVEQKLQEIPNGYGLLIIDEGIYVSRSKKIHSPSLALWALVSDLYQLASRIQAASSDPHRYASQDFTFRLDAKK